MRCSTSPFRCSRERLEGKTFSASYQSHTGCRYVPHSFRGAAVVRADTTCAFGLMIRPAHIRGGSTLYFPPNYHASLRHLRASRLFSLVRQRIHITHCRNCADCRRCIVGGCL
ncbi:hypothetical protein SCLCIDRAFT_925253 [Scleroderma citrinum Foug A]|uniref:Uncharacterized protein n=1 Tax=Scleroderma citrinum Foug A TaxID=1036808 RepID=A0A0C3DJN8_9AGAM|nr:hypothetical protein SCLCIDRAFT_925253 [Scleroderma citrinum Foug A]